MRLACYETPTEVATAVKEEFGIELDRQTVARYNPDTRGCDAAREWRDLFAATRKAYIEDMAGVAIAGQAFRVRELEKLFTQAKRSRNSKLAAELLRQAAEELGGVYTNTRALTGAVATYDPAKCTDEQLRRIAAGESPAVVLARG